MVEEKKMNLWQKIREVMKDVEYLSKDDHIKFNTTNYKAISEEKVTSTVRVSLIKHGIDIFPVEQEHLKEGNLTTVNVIYKMINSENPAEFEKIASSGTGVDTQDKGVGKAMTYAYKYMLLRTFAIPTGEDPDKISSAELDEKMKKDKEDKKKNEKISAAQQKRMFALAGKDGTDMVKKILQSHKYFKSSDVLASEYDVICKEIEIKAKEKVGENNVD
ncbi:ERF family protein [Clostridium algidicarnis]|uniref:ERF family protein n=1 Tax=Clostridium algidicarnis TaxID=37659 RepID=UPI001C0ADDAB|nr:ERF family protein [Clostridium algidicarnis]